MDCIIGAGRIGTTLAKLSGGVLITRTENWERIADLGPEDTLFICTRNDDLNEVLGKIPQTFRSKICFVQNGMLSPWLEEQLMENATRAILFFAVSAVGEEANFGGTSVVSGLNSNLVFEKFKAWGIPVKEVSQEEILKMEMEKLIWNSVFGLLGESGKCSVGESLEKFGKEFDLIIDEIHELLTVSNRIFDKGQLKDELLTYAKSVSDYQARIKEWNWRNKWFFDTAEKYKLNMETWNRMHRELGYPK